MEWLPRTSPCPSLSRSRGASPRSATRTRGRCCSWIPGEPASDGTIGDLATFAVDLAGVPRSAARGRRDDGPCCRCAASSSAAARSRSTPARRCAPSTRWAALSPATQPWRCGRRRWRRRGARIRSGCTATLRPATCSSATGNWRPSSTSARPVSGIPPATPSSRGRCCRVRAAPRSERRFASTTATWARGRGWALWKALITLAGRPADALARHTLDAVLADHARES